MFRKSIIVGLASLSATLATAQANDFQHDVSLTATVGATCSVTGAPTVQSGTGFSDFTDNTQSTFTVNVVDGKAVAETSKLRVGTVTCNGTSMDVTIDPLGTWITHDGGGGSTPGMTDEILYNAYVYDGITEVAEVRTFSGPNPNTGTVSGSSFDMDIQITPQATSPSLSLYSGDYSGTLRVSIDAN